MPTWLILSLAVVLLVVGAALPLVVRMRRTRDAAFTDAVTDVRARIEALDYRLDAAAPGTDTASATELRDTAQAMVSAANQRKSARVCRRAAAVVDRAQTVLDAAWPAS